MADATTTATPAIPTLNLAGPTAPSYTQAYNEAAAPITAAVDPSINALAPYPGMISQDASNIAGTYESEIPYEQNYYTDLAKNLAITYGTQVSTEQGQETAAVGTQKTTAAASGFDSTQGYQAAITRNIQKGYNTQIQSTLDQYGVQSDALMQEASKSITDLVAEAQTAIMQGDTEAATITGQIASLKMQEQQLITSAASTIESASTADEKAYWQQTYQSAILDIRQQTLDLQGQKVANATGDAGGKLNVSTATSYGEKLKLDPGTIQGIIDYAQSNGYSQNDIESAMMQAANSASPSTTPASTPSTSSTPASTPSTSSTIGNDINSAWSWITSNL